MDGGSAVVLEIRPASPVFDSPMLFNSLGAVTVKNGVVEVSGAKGEVGTAEQLFVIVPSRQPVRTFRVNKREIPFSRISDKLLAATVRFDGEMFRHYQQVGTYDSAFVGGRYSATLKIPGRIFRQLAARQRDWSIPWTAEDYQATWLAPQRLLLFAQIAEPDDRWQAELRVDGRVVELKKAYSAIRPEPRTFLGFYADLSLLSPEKEYRVEMLLPSLRPGQFQGLFLENIESEFTEKIAH